MSPDTALLARQLDHADPARRQTALVVVLDPYPPSFDPGSDSH